MRSSCASSGGVSPTAVRLRATALRSRKRSARAGASTALSARACTSLPQSRCGRSARGGGGAQADTDHAHGGRTNSEAVLLATVELSSVTLPPSL